MDLKDKVIAVTGAGSGIGKALCRAATLEPKGIAVIDINADNAWL